MKQLLVLVPSSHSAMSKARQGGLIFVTLPLYHCQETLPAVMLSASVRVAVIGKPMRGCNVESSTVPSSSMFVTLTVTARSAVLPSGVGHLYGHFIHVVPTRISRRLEIGRILEGERARCAADGAEFELVAISASQRPLQVAGSSTTSSSAMVYTAGSGVSVAGIYVQHRRCLLRGLSR